MLFLLCPVIFMGQGKPSKQVDQNYSGCLKPAGTTSLIHTSVNLHRLLIIIAGVTEKVNSLLIMTNLITIFEMYHNADLAV